MFIRQYENIKKRLGPLPLRVRTPYRLLVPQPHKGAARSEGEERNARRALWRREVSMGCGKPLPTQPIPFDALILLQQDAGSKPKQEMTRFSAESTQIDCRAMRARITLSSPEPLQRKERVRCIGGDLRANDEVRNF